MIEYRNYIVTDVYDFEWKTMRWIIKDRDGEVIEDEFFTSQEAIDYIEYNL